MDISRELKEVGRLLVGGTEEIHMRGDGWTENEALQDAMRSVREEYGSYYDYRRTVKVKQLKKPMKAKRVKITKSTVRKGPVRKVFVIEETWGWSGEGNSSLQRDSRFRKEYEKQGEVLKAAKELALEYGEGLTIKLKAFCEGNTELARVSPEKSEKGQWMFIMDYHM